MAGKQVRLFLVDGKAGGLTTAEIMTWTGQLLKGARKDLARIRERREAQKTGVYILLGEDEETGKTKAYIGQSDNVAKRLSTHDQSKDFWSEVVVITSKDSNLTSAHVRWLESKLIGMAKAIGRVPLENGNEPTGGADLPEADASDMEEFVRQLEILLPVLGVDVLRGRATRPAAGAPAAAQTAPAAPGGPLPVAESEPDPEAEVSPVFHLVQMPDVQAQVIDGEFTVLAGSEVAAEMPDRSNYKASSAKQYKVRQGQHRDLVVDGSIAVGPDGTARLTRDVVFGSPSAAGAVIAGRVSMNGRINWITEDNVTYASWESGSAR
ncbi:GIY-YIG nuclease family protein [Streptomyces sp. NPDC051064]|uniref:GIY-YIG nuclease family protein n=1 Tax=Streptomyces sp. NPDC051064 TaxID=3365641 RepID=UPI0037A70486